MNADDMQRRSIRSGDLVKVSNKRGQLVLRAQASEEMQPAQTFIPMHWGSQFMHGPGVNALMPSAFDRISHQPELKHAAIKVEKIDLPWRMTLMRCGLRHDLLRNLRPLLKHFEYASCGLLGRDSGIVFLRAAHTMVPDDSLIAGLDHLLGMTENAPMLRYDDAKRGISKRVLVENGQVTGVRLTGETLAAEWLKEVMMQGQFTDALRRWALAPVSTPPDGQRRRGKVVCSCLDVCENEITSNIALGADFSALQDRLKCGTQCGSCVPELKQLLHKQRKSA
jgi:assimilatory nitrate reductase catalytic subunit